MTTTTTPDPQEHGSAAKLDHSGNGLEGLSAMGPSSKVSYPEAIELRLKRALDDTSAIHILPTDLLIEIFTFLTDIPGDYPRTFRQVRKLHRIPMPFIIGRVCHKWRHLTFTTPRLWRKLEIRLSKVNQEKQLDLLRDWIKRSSDQPLHLLLDQFQTQSPPVDTYRLLVDTCSRWRTLDFTGRLDATQFWNLLDCNHSQLPLLSFLNLECDDLQGTSIARVFDRAPQLRHVHCSMPPVSWRQGGFTVSKFGINWSIVENISFSFSIRDCFFILKTASNCLRTATFTLTEFSDSSNQPLSFPDPLHLPLLEELEVIVEDANAQGNAQVLLLLRNITLPSLESLRIEFQGWSTSERNLIPELTQTLQRSRCQLQKLTIQDDVQETEVLDFLRQLPHLTSFTLRTIDRTHSPEFALSDATINALNLSFKLPDQTPSSPILPQLKRFRFDGFVGPELSEGAVNAMLKSRIEERDRGTERLTTFHVVMRASPGRKAPTTVYKWAKQLATRYNAFGASVRITVKR